MTMTAARLTPDELLAALERAGVKASRTSLNRWVRQGLVCEPVRGSGGRAVGRYSLYPPEAVGEAAASAVLIRSGVSPEEVARLRKVATTEYDLSQALAFLGDRVSLVETAEGAFVPWVWFSAAVTFALVEKAFRKEKGAAQDGIPLPKGLWYLLSKPEEAGLLHRSLLVEWWLFIREAVNSGQRVPEKRPAGGNLVLRRTERGTFRLEVVR